MDQERQITKKKSSYMRRGFLFLILFSLGSTIILTGYSPISQLQTQWSKPVDLSDGASENMKSYPTMICDKNQNMHFFWGDNSEDGAAIYYRTDRGGYLSPPNDIITVPDSNIFYLVSVISKKTNRIHLSWVNSYFSSALYYSRSIDDSTSSSRSWSAPEIIDLGVMNSSLGIDSLGIIHIVYSVSTPDGLTIDVLHRQSTDDGENWSDPKIIITRTFDQPSTLITAMSIDTLDRIHLGLTIRSQRYGEYSEVGYMRSDDKGETWGPYKMIDDKGTTWQGVNLISPYSFDANELHLTWHDPRRMHIYSEDGGESWSEPVEISPLGGAFGGTNGLVKDSSGRVYTVLAVSDKVISVTWTNGKWGLPEIIDDRFIDAHGQQISLCQGNELHVVYYDNQAEHTIWYSTRQIDAPKINRTLSAILPRTTKSTSENTPIPIQHTLLPKATQKIVSTQPTVVIPMQLLILIGLVPASLVVLLVGIQHGFRRDN